MNPYPFPELPNSAQVPPLLGGIRYLVLVRQAYNRRLVADLAAPGADAPSLWQAALADGELVRLGPLQASYRVLPTAPRPAFADRPAPPTVVDYQVMAHLPPTPAWLSALATLAERSDLTLWVGTPGHLWWLGPVGISTALQLPASAGAPVLAELTLRGQAPAPPTPYPDALFALAAP